MSPGRGSLLQAWGPPAAWCLLIFTLSSLPLHSGVHLPRGSDKAAHLVEYGVLGFLTARGFALWRPSMGSAAVLLLGAALATAWGGSDELHQFLVPERTPDWADLAADATGAAAGAVLLVLVRRRRGRGGDRGPAFSPRRSS